MITRIVHHELSQGEQPLVDMFVLQEKQKAPENLHRETFCFNSRVTWNGKLLKNR